jgi:hypothetical protein
MLYLKAVLAIAISIAAIAVTTGASADESSEKPKPTVSLCDGHSHTHTAQHHWRWAKKLIRAYSIPSWAKEKHRHSVECAAGPNHRKVMKSRWSRVQKSILPANHDLWIRIGVCEQPGSGYKGINWSHTGPTYQGGLGFWYGTWSGFKYPGMPSNAGYATWRQQMKVANRLLRMYGTSPWGCA